MIKANVNGLKYEINAVKGTDANGNSVEVPLTEEFTGTKTITTNGIHDVGGFLNALVNVPTSGETGGTKFATGTFVANNQMGKVIEHGLGVTPNVWGCYLADESAYTDTSNTNYLGKMYSVLSEVQMFLNARGGKVEYGTLAYKRPSVPADFVTDPTETTITIGFEGRSIAPSFVNNAEYVWFACYVDMGV